MKWLKRKVIVNSEYKKMRNVHDFKIDEKEFLGYLFNFKKSLIIDKTKKVEKEDYARLFEVIVWNPVYYLTNPLKIFYLWEGGMALHGGILGAIIVGYYQSFLEYGKFSFSRFISANS